MVDVIEKAREDQKATILYYKDEGRAEGKAEGLEQGEHNKQLEIARNMLKEGLDANLIKRVTGLGESDLVHLK